MRRYSAQIPITNREYLVWARLINVIPKYKIVFKSMQLIQNFALSKIEDELIKHTVSLNK